MRVQRYNIFRLSTQAQGTLSSVIVSYRQITSVRGRFPSRAGVHQRMSCCCFLFSRFLLSSSNNLSSFTFFVTFFPFVLCPFLLEAVVRCQTRDNIDYFEWSNGDVISVVLEEDELWKFTHSDETAHPFVLHCLSPFSYMVDEGSISLNDILYNYLGAPTHHLITKVRITGYGEDEEDEGDCDELEYRYERDLEGEVVAVDIVSTDDDEEWIFERIEFMWETVDAVTKVDAENRMSSYYSIDGRQLQNITRGINILRDQFGKSHKFIIK